MKELRFADQFISTVTSALATLVVSLYIIKMLHLPELDLWALCLFCLVFLLFIGDSRLTPKLKTSRLRVSRLSPMLLVISVVFLSRVMVSWGKTLPPGWDPSFHLLLAQKIQESKTLATDWLPFRNISINYPVGMHNLLAVIATHTGFALSDVFQYGFPILGCLNSLQIFVLARQILPSTRGPVYCALAYGMWAWAGSADYYRWGGLPNQLAFTFVLGAWILLIQNHRSKAIFLMLTIQLAAIPLTHHHVMTVALVLFASLGMYLCFTKQFAALKYFCSSAFSATILSSFFWIPYLKKASSITSTNAICRSEEALQNIFDIPDHMGYVFFVFSALGVTALIRKTYVPKTTHFPNITKALWVPLVFLGSVWFCLGPLLQIGSRVIWGQSCVAFTPSRFYTDAVYFLAIPAGYAFYLAVEYGRLRYRYALLLALVLSLGNFDHWRLLYKRIPVQPELEEAYLWVKEHSLKSDVLCDQEVYWKHQGMWASFLTQRPTGRTPIPVSEPQISQPPDSEAAINLYCNEGVQTDYLRGRRVLDVVNRNENNARAYKEILKGFGSEIDIVVR